MSHYKIYIYQKKKYIEAQKQSPPQNHIQIIHKNFYFHHFCNDYEKLKKNYYSMFTHEFACKNKICVYEAKKKDN